MELQLRDLIYIYYSKLNKKQKKLLSNELIKLEFKYYIFITTNILEIKVNRPNIIYII